jgi:hypothetical protein
MFTAHKQPSLFSFATNGLYYNVRWNKGCKRRQQLALLGHTIPIILRFGYNMRASGYFICG